MSTLIKFLKEVQEQFKNITWPTKDTLIQLTFVVISISIVISLILGGFDYLFTTSFGFLSKLRNQPTPLIEPAPLNATPSAQSLPNIQNLNN